jgi:hypothetical protein
VTTTRPDLPRRGSARAAAPDTIQTSHLRGAGRSPPATAPAQPQPPKREQPRSQAIHMQSPKAAASEDTEVVLAPYRLDVRSGERGAEGVGDYLFYWYGPTSLIRAGEILLAKERRGGRDPTVM